MNYLSSDTTFRDHKENYENYVSLADVLSEQRKQGNYTTDCVRMSPEETDFAFGHYNCHPIRDNLDFFDINLVCTRDFFAESTMKPSITLGYCLDGYWSEQIGDSMIEYSAGKSPASISTDREIQTITKENAGSRIKMSCLLIDADFIENSKDTFEDDSLSVLSDLLSHKECFQEFQKSPSLELILQRLVANPYHGGLANLHRENLAISAIIELSNHLRRNTTQQKNQPSGHREIASEVKYIIAQSLENTPKISQIAKNIGTNETTLRRAFKESYGMTLVDYIRLQRLEAARIMLKEKRFQIAEISYRVGYSNPANFTNAFKKQFGYAPKYEQ